ncbi:MAG: metalloregulator ArsR/SmtB family transcription factor [Bacteroidota bacterium]
MGVSKIENFSTKQNMIATYSKALSHPARVAILEEIMKKKKVTCGHLCQNLSLAQSTISQHLTELKNTGLIMGDVIGSKVEYSINQKHWSKQKNMVEVFFSRVR